MQPRTFTDWAIVRRVFGILRPHRARFGLGIALVLVGIIFELLKPLPLKVVFDTVLDNKELPALLKPWLGALQNSTLLLIATFTIVFIAVVSGALTLLSNYLNTSIIYHFVKFWQEG